MEMRSSPLLDFASDEASRKHWRGAMTSTVINQNVLRLARLIHHARERRCERTGKRQTVVESQQDEEEMRKRSQRGIYQP
jgi:hypothetical protein